MNTKNDKSILVKELKYSRTGGGDCSFSIAFNKETSTFLMSVCSYRFKPKEITLNLNDPLLISSLISLFNGSLAIVSLSDPSDDSFSGTWSNVSIVYYSEETMNLKSPTTDPSDFYNNLFIKLENWLDSQIQKN
jgi:hypothetical protein